MDSLSQSTCAFVLGINGNLKGTVFGGCLEPVTTLGLANCSITGPSFETAFGACVQMRFAIGELIIGLSGAREVMEFKEELGSS
jgi:hypothetical protein